MQKQNLEKLRAAVFKKRPALKKLYELKGKQSLFNYANSWEVKKGILNDEFLRIFKTKLKNQLSAKQTLGIIKQLKESPLVSTIDHHGIINSPFFINSNLIYSLHKGLKYLIVLSTEGVSMNNSSWPASLTHHNVGKIKKASLFRDRHKHKTVLAKKAFSKNEVVKFFAKIHNEKARKFVSKIFLAKDVLKQKSFSCQASLVSNKLWQKVFPKAPKLVYLPLESLVSDVVVKVIVKNKSHVLHRLLFTAKGWDLTEKYFEGLKGAFSKNRKGSFLFWGIDAGGKRIQLFRQGLTLRQAQGLTGIRVKLRPISIARALKQGKLYPTSLVCFLVLLYYGLTCLGGFNQITWLSDIKKRFTFLLEEMGESQLSHYIDQIPTNNFAEGNLTFLERQEKLIRPSGMDIYLEENDIYSIYLKLSKKITVAESIESLLPEMYKIVVPGKERKSPLVSITDEDIVKINGMGRKVKKIMV